MRIGQNNGVLTRIEELNYLSTWFNEFSEMQKDDFLEIICVKYGASNNKLTNVRYTNGVFNNDFVQVNGAANGAANDVDGDDNKEDDEKEQIIEVREQRKPLSIFECRMKLFNDWFANWSDEDKQDFLNRLRNSDNVFMSAFDNRSNRPLINGHNQLEQRSEISEDNSEDDKDNLDDEGRLQSPTECSQLENNLVDEEKQQQFHHQQLIVDDYNEDNINYDQSDE